MNYLNYLMIGDDGTCPDCVVLHASKDGGVERRTIHRAPGEQGSNSGGAS